MHLYGKTWCIVSADYWYTFQEIEIFEIENRFNKSLDTFCGMLLSSLLIKTSCLILTFFLLIR